MGSTGEERWLAALRDHAARLAFPNWTPQTGDRAHLYTGFVDDGTPYTEVSVHRSAEDGSKVQIYYQRYIGDELAAFWTRLLHQITE